jgi:hypothetical protein
VEGLELIERVREQNEQFNSGAPIPTVSASDLKQLWEATPRMNADMPPQPNTVTGLAVFAAYGVEAAASRPEEFMIVQLRYALLSALVRRGILQDYIQGDALNEKAFVAAATMPCTIVDLGETMIPLAFEKASAEDAAKAKEEMRARGYDPEKPNVDGKFLEWLNTNC